MKHKLINGWTKEKVLKRLEERNGFEVCADVHGNCKYRNANGKACFAGAFIENEQYYDRLEGRSVSGLCNLPSASSIFSKFPLDLVGMAKLQNIHDGYQDYLKTSTLCNETPISLKQKVQEFLEEQVWE